MALKTMVNQDLNTLRVVIGASKKLSQTDLSSLRDILAAGLQIKETSITHAKKINIFYLNVDLADQVIFVYSKASCEFQPGKNILPVKPIRKIIVRDWKRLVEAANNRGKEIKLDNIINKLDLIYDILYCECDIHPCVEKGCSAKCEKVAHIYSISPKEKIFYKLNFFL